MFLVLMSSYPPFTLSFQPTSIVKCPILAPCPVVTFRRCLLFTDTHFFSSQSEIFSLGGCGIELLECLS